MAEPAGIEARLSGLESRIVEVAADASAARHLAAAHDRDLADIGVKVDANRRAINALGVQTAARFDTLEKKFDALENKFDALENKFDALENKFEIGFAEMRAKFDQTAAGHEQIVHLLDHVIARLDDE